MWRTRVGYAGGTSGSPTYESIGDHIETIEVTYDPQVVSYDELLDRFWEWHDPSAKPYTNQYSSLVLATDEAQLAAARRSAQRYERASGRETATRIEKLERFYPAEDYHQKYYLRNDRLLMGELRAIFGEDQKALRDSTVAARLNAYLQGHATGSQLAREIDVLGLSEEGRSYLLSIVGDGVASSGCAVK